MGLIPVFVDDRQKIIDYNKVKRRLREYDVTECRMEVGDIAFANVGLELKNADDFVSSFYGHKLGRQTANVVRNYEIGRLVVIGDWQYSLLSKHRNAMQGYKSILGTIATLTLFHIPPLFVKDTREFLTILKTMVSFATGKRSDSDIQRPILFTKKSRTLLQVQSDMLTALDGVSRKTADEWLQIFGTVEKLATASVDSLEDIPGIGKKTAQYVYDIFHKNECLKKS